MKSKANPRIWLESLCDKLCKQVVSREARATDRKSQKGRGMNLHQAHLISTIQKLFRNDDRLIYFFFCHKRPELLRLGPGELLQEAQCLSSGEKNILIKAATDFG